MQPLSYFSLPLQHPVLIFTLVLLIIFFVPLLFKKLHIPAIIGLILAGVFIGPNGLNILLRDASIVLFGTVGLLYIMFLAGLEIDLNDFRKSKNRSMVFGFFTFIIPMSLGTFAGLYLLDFSLMSSILLASMFASHTLLSYPLLSKLGVTRSEAVTVAVGGTIITDTAALLVLAIIAGSVQGELDLAFWQRLIISVMLFAGMVLFVIPRVAKWFFKNVEGEGVSQYIFVMALLFASSFLAIMAGIEAIIGAFFAGLALNRLIPQTSPLMNRLEFVGNALFIPFFLIGVGMLVDVSVIFRGPEALMVALVMTVVATLAKFLAAWVTQKIFNYTGTERNILFGLSNAQAATSLAAVIVGYNIILGEDELGEPIRLLNENVLNGTVIMILVTCFISSFVTERAGRKFAIKLSDRKADVPEESERILVPIANPESIESLIDLAIMTKDAKSADPLFALAVVKDDVDAKEELLNSERMLEKATRYAAATDTKVRVVTCTDLNIASGIIRAIKDLGITQVIIGWNARMVAIDRIFGSVLDMLLENSVGMIMVSKINQPLNTFNNIVVVLPPNAEFEPGFKRWISAIRNITKRTSRPIHFYSNYSSAEAIKIELKENKFSGSVHYQNFDDWENFLIIAKNVTPGDLIVFISARRGTISFTPVLETIPRKLSKHFEDYSFVIIYPEQIQETEVLKSLQ
jgi:Kef-type K+ transport system membrane component KefB